jgi:hypothetical protein
MAISLLTNRHLCGEGYLTLSLLAERRNDALGAGRLLLEVALAASLAHWQTLANIPWNPTFGILHVPLTDRVDETRMGET